MFPLYFRPIGISHLGRILCSKGRPCVRIGAPGRSDADAGRAALAKSPGISYIYKVRLVMKTRTNQMKIKYRYINIL